MQCIKPQVLPRQTQRSEAEFPPSQGQSVWKHPQETRPFTHRGSAAAYGHDSSLGQILYTTTLDLGFIFNLGHHLRNLFFLQRVKIICYCLPLSGVLCSFKGKVWYIPPKAWLRTRKGHRPSLDAAKRSAQSLVVRNEANLTIQRKDAAYVQVPFSFAFCPASGTPAPSG